MQAQARENECRVQGWARANASDDACSLPFRQLGTCCDANPKINRCLPQQLPPPDGPPIRGLPVLSGYRCSCGWITTSERELKFHCRKLKHPTYKTISVQTFNRSPQFVNYFEVKIPESYEKAVSFRPRNSPSRPP